MTSNLHLLARATQALFATWLLTHCASITPAPTVAFTDHRHAMLHADLEYVDVVTGQKILVPAGFVTDHASIPPSLRRYFEAGGQAYQYPAIIHDWLYWSQITNRAEADRIFAAAMEDCGVGEVKRKAIHAGVRAGGESAWKKNQKEREQGLFKVIPASYRDPRTWPANITWPQFRQHLFDSGVR
ncbi:DUF1353 domain-containing protein [Prosthecobacter dejongeii]|uniref:DUF1353 domain-containing protein n=1 Tax=Prosthecobacter dejongeii TaxID=48465 RepID=A0A7W7YMR8_9BACT|nr:DUF1353 domain-containing protein [Prosthecobacter dejongeii]MBB5039055.1 hypothetical protein [Prosthecobacter dejongeii]